MSAPPQDVMFAFDWAHDALVFPGPNGQPMGITVAALKALRWQASSEGFRASLPRFDPPQVVVSEMQAPAMGNRHDRRMQEAMRRGGR